MVVWREQQPWAGLTRQEAMENAEGGSFLRSSREAWDSICYNYHLILTPAYSCASLGPGG